MKITDNLQQAEGNYILPFFWQHGESEEVLRKYMQVIYDSNIREVCLEARPHPDFAGAQWFRDFDIILDEAKKLGMKLWILDDAHFPSGQAAGHMDQEPEHLQKTYLNYHAIDLTGPTSQIQVDIEPMAHYYPNPFQGGTHPFIQPDLREYKDPEKLIAVVAGRLDGKVGDIYHVDELVDLTDRVENGILTWDVPDGPYRLWVIYETHKGGGRCAVNFLSKESCALQIKHCYEPHYQRYKEEFGKTILGFFSDEPEVGNTASYSADAAHIGNPTMPIPWSEEMPELMNQRFGEDYAHRLVALWNTVGTEEETADVRVGYMDIVSRLCQKNFGEQLGEYCRERGLKYIGHIVEDCDASPNLGSSQGHYFRALWGQDWAGVDNIGGQVTIGGANVSHCNLTGMDADGEFYHHELAKLGTSLADIDPKKKGNTMCETFGAYGWSEGTRLMKYQADHLLVRGINHFVPHAFNPKEFPDFDCPPHFYAHGRNPLYKPFGTLMKYINRVSHLISGGFHHVDVAILYHAEAEWSGMEYLEMGRVARYLDDAQIDFDFIPADVFADPQSFDSFYDDEGLHINGHVFTALIVPGMAYVTDATRAFLQKAKETDFLVLFANRVPNGMEDGYVATDCEKLVHKLQLAGLTDAVIAPECSQIQIYHYSQEQEDYYLISNESSGKIYTGKVILPIEVPGHVFAYDAFENRLSIPDGTKTACNYELPVTIAPFEMMILVIPASQEQDEILAKEAREKIRFDAKIADVTGEWTVSYCSNENYPIFTDAMKMQELCNLNLLKKDWSGIARYENTVVLERADMPLQLRIPEAYESVEVWINHSYAGERICPPYHFDLTGLAVPGKNEIRIECRTTLERMVHGITHGMGPFGPEFGAVYPSGLVGTISVWKK